MTDVGDVKGYWDRQARTLGSAPDATTRDVFMRSVEIDYVAGFLSSFHKPLSVLDIGCGNGYSTIEYRKRVPQHRYVGGDYSEEMIASATEELANQDISEGLAFDVVDVMDLASRAETYDVILSDRCLINLGGSRARVHALRQIAQCLDPGGIYLMVENFIEGHMEMNRVREYVGLPEIPVRWHNSFFSIPELEDAVRHVFRIEALENISSLYYLVTRVVYSKLCEMEGREPDYHHPIYEVAAQLPIMGNFGPIHAARLVRV